MFRCLTALQSQQIGDCEILICDDGSDPALDLAEVASIGPQAQLFRLEGRGPGAARNLLAHRAKGNYLFFLDADTQPGPETIESARRIIAENPGIQAFFGSYDDTPQSVSSVSLYVNLRHHHVHQKSAGRVSVFWCGCGVMLRQLYLKSAGLSESYAKASIEDTELGMRLNRQGVAIYLFPQLQVKHLKCWSFGEWLYTDLFLRGIPWVRQMRSNKDWLNELNFSWQQRLSSLTALLFFAALFAAPLWWRAAAFSPVALGAFVCLNWDFLSLVAVKRGLRRAAAMVPLHLIYSLVCIVALVVGLCSSPAGEGHDST